MTVVQQPVNRQSARTSKVSAEIEKLRQTYERLRKEASEDDARYHRIMADLSAMRAQIRRGR
jgi:predicted  nucleic acid-binding Zn-ribbon protein